MEIKNLDRIRLKPEIAVFLKSRVSSIDSKAKIYLFGSRADIQKKGGDIDLLILSENKLPLSQLSKIKQTFWDEFGYQKLDLVNFTHDENPPFKRLIMPDAVEL